MTSSTVSVIADAPRSCTVYAWCQLDHTDPEIVQFAPHSHEKRITLKAGDVSQGFLLEVVKGVPRIECSLDVDEIWREPDEGTDSFRNLSDIFATASSLYEAFVRELTPTLKRAHAVTHELASRDI
ncbi:hypothetical protein [Microbacterium sp. 1.5R]|uniref:hypothetical protein n=1 Tax=Microbacterium sp. 1.5R TaxID=1916917 RepID=UPI00119D1D8C|nr:hypothetical protein [Microbacterium sp. 1.5R]